MMSRSIDGRTEGNNNFFSFLVSPPSKLWHDVFRKAQNSLKTDWGAFLPLHPLLMSIEKSSIVRDL